MATSTRVVNNLKDIPSTSVPSLAMSPKSFFEELYLLRPNISISQMRGSKWETIVDDPHVSLADWSAHAVSFLENVGNLKKKIRRRILPQAVDGNFFSRIVQQVCIPFISRPTKLMPVLVMYWLIRE